MKYRLIEICAGITDGSHNPPAGGCKSDYMMISSKNVFDDEITLDDPRYLTEDQFNQENKRTRVASGDVLMTIVGTVGRTAVVPNDFANITLQRSVAVLHPNNDICKSRYLMYLLRAKRHYFESEAHGVAQKGIYLKQLSDVMVDIPEIAEQTHILDILDHLQKVIFLRKQELIQLNEIVKARFVEMFGFPGMDPFKYAKTKLGSCCEINPKKTKDNRLVDNIEISFVPMTAVSEKGEIDSSDVRRYEDVKKGFTYFTEGDVLFAKITPCMENGKGAVAKGLKNGIGFGSTEFHVLRPIDGISNPYWVYAITSFKSFRKEAESNMTGSAGQRRTPVSFLENYEVSLPPIELQNQFADFVARTNKSKLLEARQARFIAKTRPINKLLSIG